MYPLPKPTPPQSSPALLSSPILPSSPQLASLPILPLLPQGAPSHTPPRAPSRLPTLQPPPFIARLRSASPTTTISQITAVGELSTAPTLRHSTRQRKVRVRRSPQLLFPERIWGYVAAEERVKAVQQLPPINEAELPYLDNKAEQLEPVNKAEQLEPVDEAEHPQLAEDAAAALNRALTGSPPPALVEGRTKLPDHFVFQHRALCQPVLLAYLTSSDLWYIRNLQLMVAMLHTQFNVTFQACAMLLQGLGLVLHGLRVQDAEDLPKTLTTVLSKLELDDQFEVAPSCVQCHRLYSSKSSPLSVCDKCNKPLFHPLRRSLFERLSPHATPSPIPIRAVPIIALRTLLEDFLAEGSNELEVDAWRDEEAMPGFATRIMDGNVWESVVDGNGRPFFDAGLLDEPNELRIGLTFLLDWYVWQHWLYNTFLTSLQVFSQQLAIQRFSLDGRDFFLYCQSLPSP